MGKKKSNSDYLVQGTVLTIASIVVRIIGMIYRIPITNIIGDQGNAIYSAAYEIYSIILMISSFSIPLAVSKMVSEKVAKRQRKHAYQVFKAALVFSLFVGGVAAILTFLFADKLAFLMKMPPSVYALKVLAPTLFVSAVLGAIRGYFQGLGTMAPTAVSQVIEQIINAIVSVVATYFFFQYGVKQAAGDTTLQLGEAYGAAGGTLGTGIGTIAALLFLVALFRTYQKRLKKQLYREKNVPNDSYKDIYYKMFMTIIPVVLSTVVYNISNIVDQGIFNNVMVDIGMSRNDYSALWGMYSGKFRTLMNVPLSMASCLTPSMIPSLVEAMVYKDFKEAKRKIRTSIRFTMVITIPCAVGFIVLGSPILQLLFNDTRKKPAQIMMLGSIMLIFYALSTLGNGILQGIGKMKEPVINAAIAFLLHLPVLLILLRLKGVDIFAVVIANIFFAIVMSILNQRAIKKHLGYHQEITKTFVIPLISSLIMGAGTYLTHKLTVTALGKGYVGNLVGTALALVIAIVLYIVMLLKLKGISEEEMYDLPKGGTLVRLAKKARLLP